jgi:2-dehydro-3-deoxygalactonokinase
VSVRDGAVHGIDTVMTGECFALLKERSVLARSLDGWAGDIRTDDFLRGVAVARKVRNPLQSAFSVRALDVLGGLPGAEARGSYLSGLLIGAEVAGMAETWGSDASPVTLVGEPRLAVLYRLACRSFGLEATALDESDCFVAGASVILASTR